MTKHGTGQPKYGTGNCHLSMEGEDIVIRIDSTRVLVPAGQPKKDGEPRANNLVATTRGFTGVGPCAVSLNVTS